MSDPRRWIETEDAELRSTLKALSTMAPTSELKEQVWAKIGMTLPGGPGDGSPSGSGPGAGSPSVSPRPGGVGSSSGALKIGATLLGAFAVGASAIVWMAQSPPVANVSAHAVKDSSAIALSAEQGAPQHASPVDTLAAPAIPAVVPAPKRAPASAPAAAPPPPESHDVTAALPAASVAPPIPADGLREEAEAVRKVRQSLRAGDPPAALRELERIAARMPNGPLEEEREVLTIEALRASGSTEAARRRADRFLFERPQSMHVARVRAIAGTATDAADPNKGAASPAD